MEQKQDGQRSSAPEKKSNRKQYAKQGSGSQQKMMSFRLDADLQEWLDTKENKGRLINKLLHKLKEREEENIRKMGAL